MRRALLFVSVLGLAGLAGCSGFRDMFSAHANNAAEAGGVDLSSKRLAEILFAATKGQRLTNETAEFVANAWVDYALFAVASTSGQLPTDSASVAEVLWPELAELKGTHFHDTLMAKRAAPSERAADSVYSAPDVRLFQHILFGARAGAPANQKAATRKKAEAALAQVRRGESFGRLATQLSEDPGSRADSGYLPPGPRGRFVPAFDSAAWALGPGETSGLVETPFGYHIIKRPSLAEVRPRIDDYLAQRAGARLDSMYMDSLAAAANIRMAGGAPAAIRSALENSESSRESATAVATFDGGSLTVRELMRWVRALPPQYSAQLRGADDSTLIRFARVLTQNVLLLRQADSASVTVTPEEWADLRGRYLAQLDTLKREMGLADGGLADSSAKAGERTGAAAIKVEQYFDQLTSGQSRLRPLPSALATLLRERMPYRIYDAGVRRALELAQAMKPAPDSAAPPGALRRAPGPPPVPGAAAPAQPDSGATRR